MRRSYSVRLALPAAALLLLGCHSARPAQHPAALEPRADAPVHRVDDASPDLAAPTPQEAFGPRVRALVAQMTLAEKASLLIADAAAIARLGIPKYNFWNEGLHGVANDGFTAFPQANNLAATWDQPLIARVGEVIGTEGRGSYNDWVARTGASPLGGGINFFAPNINIERDPRWGRGHETYGEDPFLTSRIAVAYIRGMQGDHPLYVRAIATPKHFAVHSGPEPLRNDFNVAPSLRDLEETYFPQFEAAIREGNARSIMASYNAIDGVPATANRHLLVDVLRTRWGFDGFVVSDCEAVAHLFDRHHFVRSYPAAAGAAVGAGTDVDCGEVYLQLPTAVAQGSAAVADIDRAVTNVLMERFRLGAFDPPESVPYSAIPRSVVDSAEHRAFALTVARESMVLLKNEGALLPLAPTIRRIAVIGPTADRVQALIGNYSGRPNAPKTLLTGLRDHAPQGVTVGYEAGCDLIDPSRARFRAATALARRSDVVIAVLGLTTRLEAEEGAGDPHWGSGTGDRPHLDLPPVQQQLLEALVATRKPVVLVLTGSGAGLRWSKEHVPAIVWAGYPGEEGGIAVADVVYGRYNPAGRLPVTFYASADDLPPFANYDMAGRTYRFFSGVPAYAFGDGLSYTTFRYQNASIPAQSSTAAPLAVSFDVVNTGARDGDEVVEAYVSHGPGAPTPAPIRSLVAFARVHTTAGSTTRVTLTIQPHELAVVDANGRRYVEAGSIHLAIGGKQPRADGTYAEGEGVSADVSLTGETWVHR